MENYKLGSLYSVPNIIFNGIKTTKDEIIEEYKFEWVNKIFVQQYSDYNMIVLKTNVFDRQFQLNEIKEVKDLILDEAVVDESAKVIEYTQHYSNMKLLLTFRDSQCGYESVTNLYYIFASKDIKENSLKKELNWLLDRETNQSMVQNLSDIRDRIKSNVNGINNINYNLKEVNNCLNKIKKVK